MKKLFIGILLVLFSTKALYSQTLSQTIYLKPGYNFISLNINPSVTSVQLKETYTAIEDIYSYSSAAGSFLSIGEGTLTTLSAGRGYIIKSSSTATVDIAGSQINQTWSIKLKAGFNIVGFSKVSANLTFKQIMSNCSMIRGMYKWNNTAGSFIQVIKNEKREVVEVDGLDPQIVVGSAYFIDVENDTSINYENNILTIGDYSFKLVPTEAVTAESHSSVASVTGCKMSLSNGITLEINEAVGQGDVIFSSVKHGAFPNDNDIVFYIETKKKLNNAILKIPFKTNAPQNFIKGAISLYSFPEDLSTIKPLDYKIETISAGPRQMTTFPTSISGWLLVDLGAMVIVGGINYYKQYYYYSCGDFKTPSCNKVLMRLPYTLQNQNTCYSAAALTLIKSYSQDSLYGLHNLLADTEQNPWDKGVLPYSKPGNVVNAKVDSFTGGKTKFYPDSYIGSSFGYTLAEFYNHCIKAIDEGRPVIINIGIHSCVAVGYLNPGGLENFRLITHNSSYSPYHEMSLEYMYKYYYFPFSRPQQIFTITDPNISLISKLKLNPNESNTKNIVYESSKLIKMQIPLDLITEKGIELPKQFSDDTMSGIYFTKMQSAVVAIFSYYRWDKNSKPDGGRFIGSIPHDFQNLYVTQIPILNSSNKAFNGKIVVSITDSKKTEIVKTERSVTMLKSASEFIATDQKASDVVETTEKLQNVHYYEKINIYGWEFNQNKIDKKINDSVYLINVELFDNDNLSTSIDSFSVKFDWFSINPANNQSNILSPGQKLLFVSKIGNDYIDNEKIKWSVEPANGGVSVSSTIKGAFETNSNASGKYTIHAQVDDVGTIHHGKEAIYEINVTPSSGSSLVVESSKYKVGFSEKAELSATLNGAAPASVTWTIENDLGEGKSGKLSTQIGNKCMFTAPCKEGEYVVSATSNGQKTPCKITVMPLKMAIIMPPDMDANAVQSVTVSVTGITEPKEIIIASDGGLISDFGGEFIKGNVPEDNVFNHKYTFSLSSGDTKDKYSIDAKTNLPENNVAAQRYIVITRGINISPKGSSILPGGSLTFEASYSGLKLPAEWKIESNSGSIEDKKDGTMVYTAPATPGVYKITATYKGYSDETLVTVTPPEQAASIKIKQCPTTIGAGQRIYGIYAEVTGVNDASLIWSSDGGWMSPAPSYQGNFCDFIAPETAGTYKIKVKIANTIIKDEFEIIVTGMAFRISPSKTMVEINKKVRLNAVIEGADSGYFEITDWRVEESGGGSVEAIGGLYTPKNKDNSPSRMTMTNRSCDYTAPNKTGIFHVSAKCLDVNAGKTWTARAELKVIGIEVPGAQISAENVGNSITMNIDDTLPLKPVISGADVSQSTYITDINGLELKYRTDDEDGKMLNDGNYVPPIKSLINGETYFTSVLVEMLNPHRIHTINVGVPDVKIKMLPDVITLGVGETYNFNCEVSGLTNKPPLTWSSSGTLAGNSTNSRIYTASAIPGTGYVRSEFTYGVRNLQITRNAQAAIKIEDITIDSDINNALIENGGTKPFNVFIGGAFNKNVDAITIEGGPGATIENASAGSGYTYIFKAPLYTGQFTTDAALSVKVVSAANKQKFNTFTVKVKRPR